MFCSGAQCITLLTSSFSPSLTGSSTVPPTRPRWVVSFSACTSYIMLRGHFYRSGPAVAPCLTLITLCLWLSVSGCPSFLCLPLANNGASLVVCLSQMTSPPITFPRVLLTNPHFNNPRPTGAATTKKGCRSRWLCFSLNPKYSLSSRSIAKHVAPKLLISEEP